VVLTQETTSPSKTSEGNAERLGRVAAAAYRIRHHALNMGEVQGQGYVGQALGAADMLAAVYADQLRYRADDPEWEGRDRFLLSTGHYAIGHYAALAEAGVIPVQELETYGSDDSRLPMSGMSTYTPGMEISGGSLGHGLPIAVGMALGLRHQGSAARVYNFLSDGELDEGSTWEAAMGAHHHKLGNLTEKWEAFGWYTQRVDGNNMAEVLQAFDNAAAQAAAVGRPSVILCDTKVGRGVPLLEDREKAHFMRIEEHEWQLCREQLTAGYEGKATR
jgi:transketolase